MKSNFNDQLLLATDKSKCLQEKIEELQSENSGLQGEIDDLSKQKEEALTRYIWFILIKKNQENKENKGKENI